MRGGQKTVSDAGRIPPVYFGYLACQPVAALLLQRFSVIRYLYINCFIWGVIMCCHAAVQGPQAMLALRFLLGFFEGGLIPCTTLLTANFYAKHQIVARSAILQCMNGVSILFGAPMAYGLLKNGGLVIESWRVMFLILGGITVVLSLLIALVLAPSPKEARFLHADERTALDDMLKQTSVDATQGKGNARQQIVEALTDVRLYLMWLLPFAVSITNGGITVFNTALIQSFGFSSAQSILLTMPSGAIQVISVFIYVGLFRLTGTRAAGAITCLVLSVIGGGLVVGGVGNQAASMTGILMVVFYVQSLACCVAYIATNVGGHTKRVVFATSFQVAYAAGNIVGPQTYRPKDAPKYVPAQIAILVTLSSALALLVAITFFHWLWNRQRDSRGDSHPDERLPVEGLTDKQLSERVVC